MAKLIKIPSPPIGLYRLAQDVENPYADLRYRDGWLAARWEKGDLFSVTADHLGLYVELNIVRNPRGCGKTFVVKNEHVLGLIVPHLEPAPLDTLAMTLVYCQHVLFTGTDALIRLLVEGGDVTKERLVEVAQKRSKPV